MTMNESNSTEDSSIEWFPGLQITACIIYSIILLIGIIGNILVIVTVTRYRDMRNATNLLLTNLSIADLLLLIFCTAEGYQHLYGKDKHRLGKFMCSFSPFIQNATSTCSVLTIMAISYERYIAICQPLKSSSLRLPLFRTLPAVIFFWLISCLISIPFYKYSKTTLEQAIYGETIITCITAFPKQWAKPYLISCTVCLYLAIFILLCYWHFSICCILFNREALLRDNTILTRYRRQVAQLLIVLIILFFTLILPYKIWALIEGLTTFEELSRRISFHTHAFILVITRSLLYLNSAINPLLYSIMSTKFRQCFMLLCDDCRRSAKNRRSGVVFFGKDHTVKHIMGISRPVGGRTISTTEKVSSHQANPSQLHEQKLLLAGDIPATVDESPIDANKFACVDYLDGVI